MFFEYYSNHNLGQNNFLFKILKEFVLDTKSNFLEPISLQPDWYSNDLSIVQKFSNKILHKKNIHSVEYPIHYSYFEISISCKDIFIKYQSLWQRLNTFLITICTKKSLGLTSNNGISVRTTYARFVGAFKCSKYSPSLTISLVR